MTKEEILLELDCIQLFCEEKGLRTDKMFLALQAASESVIINPDLDKN